MIPNYRFGSEELPVQAGRYLLVVSPACPYCRRVTIARRLLGLEAAIGVRYATGSGPDGFEFIRDGYSYDPLLMVRSARELYRRQPNFEPDDPQTVPVILDSKRDNQIVATESADMLLDFCTAWKPFTHFEAPDLYPAAERAKLDALDAWLNKQLVTPSWAVSHGEADGQTRRNFSLALERLEEMLRENSFLTGEQPVESDIRAFVVFQVLSSSAPEMLRDFEAISEYLSRLSKLPAWVSPEEAAALDPNYSGSSESEDTAGAIACSA